MCKFKKPEIPANITADERRSLMFNALSSLDLNDKLEKRENDKLSYLSWANAWAEFKAAYPSATYRVIKNPENNLPYFTDPNVGIMVFTEVTVDDLTHSMWLPVMDSKNKAMKLNPYTYQVWDSYKKAYIEKTVQAATMFDINKTLMRCLGRILPCLDLDFMSMLVRIFQQTIQQTDRMMVQYLLPTQQRKLQQEELPLRQLPRHNRNPSTSMQGLEQP